jgi:hypothetical protein
MQVVTKIRNEGQVKKLEDYKLEQDTNQLS